MLPGPLKQVGEAGRSGDTALGIGTEGQWDPPSTGEDWQLVKGKSISFYKKFTFSVTPRDTELGCVHKNGS